MKFFTALFVTFFLGTVFLAQNTNELTKARDEKVDEISTKNSKSSGKRIIKKKGWNIPPSFFESDNKKRDIDLNGIKVERREMSFKSEIFTFERYISSDNMMEIVDEDCKINKIFSYNLNNKIFAYEIRYSPVIVKNNKIQRYIGLSYNIFYTDLDGDGLFEERYGSFKLPNVPSWVNAINK